MGKQVKVRALSLLFPAVLMGPAGRGGRPAARAPSGLFISLIVHIMHRARADHLIDTNSLTVFCRSDRKNQDKRQEKVKIIMIENK